MSATVSVEILMSNLFDKFYDECNFKDVELSWKLKGLLDELEFELIEVAKDRSTTEAKDIYNKGYDDGYDDAREDYC